MEARFIGFVAGVTIITLPLTIALMSLLKWAIFKRLPLTRQAALPWSAGTAAVLVGLLGCLSKGLSPLTGFLIYGVGGTIVWVWSLFRHLKALDEPDPTMDQMYDVFR